MSGARQYLGRGWSFPPRFDAAGATVAMVEGEEDVRQSLRILLSTIRSERTMLPDFGLEPDVFMATDESSLTQLKTRIADAILYYEPRIVLSRIELDHSRIADGILLVDLHYVIPGVNSRSNVVYPFYLREGTNVRLAGEAV